MRPTVWLLAVAMTACAQGTERGEQIVWEIDNTSSIGGHATIVLGAPTVIDVPGGKAVEFDGESDGLLVEQFPLAGFRTFTAEVVFKPYPDGPEEQRFFHMQEFGTDNRVMFETRLTDDGRWFLDTFILSGAGSHPMYAEDYTHPIGPWYHAAIVVDGTTFKHYVNGSLELSTEIEFEAFKPGRSSIGVRQNEVYWYKGAIRKARFTPHILSPEQFLEVGG